MTESDKYDVLEKIGHGSFGVIRKVRRKVDGVIICRKEISYLKMSQKEREQLHAEFQILSCLRHPNIVGYYHREHLKATQDLHLYMEYCGNGDLGRVIRDLQQKNQYAEESFVWSIFAQLVTALYRCHYGVDPPEVGKTVLGLGTTAKPKAPTGGMTILHRDLKPENVFLSEDNSVKLGDFGLSKMIQSHDFASTYVGTPFYMSPEICAAEKYTLKSDIWSLGCIIYELCSREPPFNAKSHFQLVQKIKEGKIASLPPVYSAELMAVIKDCLKVNPDRRPDTATLLNLPVVRLMRKEKEVVEFSKLLKVKEEALNKRIRELEQKMASMETDRAYMRQEVDASLRREWEVKARLEIDRLVNQEIESLQKKFEVEVQARVDVELQTQQKKTVTFAANEDEQDDFSSSLGKSDYPHSSVGATSADGDFPSTTDISELSMDSPEAPSKQPQQQQQQQQAGPRKTARTPFGRAQTMFAGVAAGTPMDVEMASPSPITIASLSLSPRRNGVTKAPATNPSTIFDANSNNNNNSSSSGDPRWDAPREGAGLGSDFDSDDEDDAPMPSPTRMVRTGKNPFTSKQRPALHAQKSAPLQPQYRLQSKQTNKIATSSNPDLLGAGGPRSASPNRRLSKIPSAANLAFGGSAEGGGGPQLGLTRKPSITKKDMEQAQQQQPALLSKLGGGKTVGGAGATNNGNNNNNNNVRGRTLVELQQARAGGRPMSAVLGTGESAVNVSPKRAFREHAAAANRGGVASEPPAVWDPERDEMPSPFLVRRKPLGRV